MVNKNELIQTKFELNEKEIKEAAKFIKFVKKFIKENHYTNDIQLQYNFKSNGIGQSCTIVDLTTGLKKDITDYGIW